MCVVFSSCEPLKDGSFFLVLFPVNFLISWQRTDALGRFQLACKWEDSVAGLHSFYQFSALLITAFFKRASKALLNVMHMPKDIALKHGWDDIVQVLARLQDTCP